ncbi:hypothetical protein nublan007_46270 [Klebsiella pneumoniae]
MKYVFIEKHQAEFSIKAMCRVLQVTRSGWYIWHQRRYQVNRRQQFRLVCDNVVREAFSDAKQRYGAPRLTDELRAQGYRFNVKTVAASLRRQGLRAKASRKFSPVSYREHGLPVSENLLKQDFYASGPNQKWVGDITYLRTGEGWLYLAVVIDLWSRSVIGWSMSSRMTAQLACDALQMALWRRKRPLFNGLPELAETPQSAGEYERQRLLLRQCLCGKLLPYAEGGMYPRRGLCQPGNHADSSV